MGLKYLVASTVIQLSQSKTDVLKKIMQKWMTSLENFAATTTNHKPIITMDGRFFLASIF